MATNLLSPSTVFTQSLGSSFLVSQESSLSFGQNFFGLLTVFLPFVSVWPLSCSTRRTLVYSVPRRTSATSCSPLVRGQG